MALFVGTSGWSIANKHHGAAFPPDGSGLERYAARFSAVEINSSFYRPHRLSTWARWAATVPSNFRFAVKLPKTITHERKLIDCAAPLDAFAEEIAQLGPKLGVVLVQLPPSFGLDVESAGAFFDLFRDRIVAPITCEPRHPSWFAADADALLAAYGIARVAADPARVPEAGVPGGWRGLSYWRLHGSPAMYRTSYNDGRIERYAAAITTELARGRDAWCMFDNTMSSAATGDALKLVELLTSSASVPRP